MSDIVATAIGIKLGANKLVKSAIDFSVGTTILIKEIVTRYTDRKSNRDNTNEVVLKVVTQSVLDFGRSVIGRDRAGAKSKFRGTHHMQSKLVRKR